MEDCLSGLKPVLARGEPHGSVSENKYFLMAEENEITILEYFDNKLNYWSDNSFDVPKEFDDSLYAEPILFLKNGWFLPQTVRAGNEMIVGLLRVRTDFGFENDIIKSGLKDFRMPANTGFNIKMTLQNTRSPITREHSCSRLPFHWSRAILFLLFSRLHYGLCCSFWLSSFR